MQCLLLLFQIVLFSKLKNMAKAPLKQLSVNTFESNRLFSPKSSTKKVKAFLLREVYRYATQFAQMVMTRNYTLRYLRYYETNLTNRR